MLRLFAPPRSKVRGEDRERPYRVESRWRVIESYTGCKLGEMQNHACRASSKNLISSYGNMGQSRLPAFLHARSIDGKYVT